MSTIAANCPQQGAGSVTPPGNYEFGDFGRGDSARLLRRYRLGLGLCVCAIVMLFVGLTSAYVVRRGIPAYYSASGAYSTAWEPLHLPLALLVVNTLLLVAASLTIEVARRASLAASCAAVPKRKSRSAQVWSLSSLLLLAGFIAGQTVAWQQLRASGELLTSGA